MHACRLKQELELKQHSLSLFQERIAGSESAQIESSISQAEAQLESAQKASLDARDLKAEMIATAKASTVSYTTFQKSGVQCAKHEFWLHHLSSIFRVCSLHLNGCRSIPLFFGTDDCPEQNSKLGKAVHGVFIL